MLLVTQTVIAQPTIVQVESVQAAQITLIVVAIIAIVEPARHVLMTVIAHRVGNVGMMGHVKKKMVLNGGLFSSLFYLH